MRREATKKRATKYARKARAKRSDPHAQPTPAEALFNKIDGQLWKLADVATELENLLPEFAALPANAREWIYDHIDVVVGGGIDWVADKYADHVPSAPKTPRPRPRSESTPTARDLLAGIIGAVVAGSWPTRPAPEDLTWPHGPTIDAEGKRVFHPKQLNPKGD